MSHPESMSDEFDTVALWTALAVEELGPDHALPAACRGSGSPDAMGWLAETMGLREGVSLLDVGAGVGGPAELAARTYGVRPFLVEPMSGACRAARRLFARPTAVGDGSALPFGDHTFEAVWALGVLCTLEDKAPTLAEIARVVTPTGAVGLLVYVTEVDVLPDQPDGNHFPTSAELERLLDDAGLRVVATALLTDFAEPSSAWQTAASRVDDLVEQEHADDERWSEAQSQQDAMGRLLDDGLVVGHLLVCRPI